MVSNPTHSLLPLLTCYIYQQLIKNRPLTHQRRTFTLSLKSFKSFRRFDRIQIKVLENKLISETLVTVGLQFKHELAAFIKTCNQLIAVSYKNSKIRVQNFEKEMTTKDKTLKVKTLVFHRLKYK